MIPAEVLHHIAGRIRVRIPSAKSTPSVLEHICKSLTKFPGVLGVSANPMLGTLIIRYQPAIFGDVLQDLTDRASKAELFLLSAPHEEDDDPVVSLLDRGVERVFTKVNRITQETTGHAVNLKEVFPLGVLVYAVLFVDKAIAASQWLSWVQFAISTYLEMHEDEPIAGIGDSVEALRAELQELRKELQTHFGNQKTLG
jgi:hypothetical protein